MSDFVKDTLTARSVREAALASTVGEELIFQ